MADILNPDENYNPKLGLKSIYTKLVEMIKVLNTAVSNIATNTAAIAAMGTTPKIYKALLTQSGTSAPVATVLVNTLSGTPVWSYSTVGRYLLTLVGEFDVSKTMIYISNNDIASLFSSYRVSDDVIRLECSDLSLVKADDLVNGLPITIEVYP